MRPRPRGEVSLTSPPCVRVPRRHQLVRVFECFDTRAAAVASFAPIAVRSAPDRRPCPAPRSGRAARRGAPQRRALQESRYGAIAWRRAGVASSCRINRRPMSTLVVSLVPACRPCLQFVRCDTSSRRGRDRTAPLSLSAEAPLKPQAHRRGIRALDRLLASSHARGSGNCSASPVMARWPRHECVAPARSAIVFVQIGVDRARDVA